MFKRVKKSKDQKSSGKKGSSSKDSQQGPPQSVPECNSLGQPAGVLLDRPWRAPEWSKRKSMKDDLRKLKISTPNVEQLRILVHGPVGAGKSSFINSIDSIFQERMTSAAIADAIWGHSLTKIFQIHNIRNTSYDLPFSLCDIMGLDAGCCEGVEMEDLVNVLKGHIRDGYTFNPTSACSEGHPNFNSNPKPSDRIHCLVSVISANHVSMMDNDVISNMVAVRAKAGWIPHVVVLTKIDETCPNVAEDIKQVYMSKKIKNKMKACSERLGTPMNCIFPLKNYHEETDLNDEMDVLLLHALKHILNFANDHAAAMKHQILIGDKSTQNPPPPLGQRDNIPSADCQQLETQGGSEARYRSLWR